MALLNLKQFDKKLDYSNILPDCNKDNVIESPFAITEYTCNPNIGTNEDLMWLRVLIYTYY